MVPKQLIFRSLPKSHDSVRCVSDEMISVFKTVLFNIVCESVTVLVGITSALNGYLEDHDEQLSAQRECMDV